MAHDTFFYCFLKSVGQSLGQIGPTKEKALTFPCKCLNFSWRPQGDLNPCRRRDFIGLNLLPKYFSLHFSRLKNLRWRPTGGFELVPHSDKRVHPKYTFARLECQVLIKKVPLALRIVGLLLFAGNIVPV